MVSFISKKIEDDIDLGSRLRSAREKMQISIEDAANMTGINQKYLKAFEGSDFKDMPEGVYLSKFLKKYTEYLDLKIENPLLLLPADILMRSKDGLYQMSIEKNNNFFKKVKNFILNPYFFRRGLLLLFVLGGMICFFSIVYNAFKPPRLEIISPIDNLVTQDYVIKIKGITEKEAKIFINDKEVLSSVKGLFEENIDLKKGLNTVKISVKKKYSKESVVYRQILVTDNSANVSLK